MMVTASDRTKAQLDPVELLNQALELTWHNLCCTYDASGKLPDTRSLFTNADLRQPRQAAQTVLANMLMEVMENVGRFSAWYTRPARAFGLISLHDPLSGQNRWMLAPEAVLQWQDLLQQLERAIDLNYSLIQAMLYVEDLLEQASPGDEWIIARCGCDPPRTIQVTRSVLDKAEILCHACLQPFSV